mgnify:CR=1 FL=1
MPPAALRYSSALALVATTMLLPFNSVPWLGSRLGELSGEAWIAGGAFLLGVVGLEGIVRRRIRLPRTLSWYCLAGWFAWAGLSGLLRVALSADVVFKGRTLLEKFALQLTVAGFVTCVATACYAAFTSWRRGEPVLAFVRAAVWASLVVPLLFAVLEGVAILLPDSRPADLFRALSRLVHVRPEYEARLRSVAGEASWFGVWLAFALPWVLSTAFQSGRAAWGILLILAASTGLTFSRMAWAVAFLAGGGFLLSHLWLLRSRVMFVKAIGIAGGVLVLGASAAIADWERATGVLGSVTLDPAAPHWISNSSRLGMQVAAVGVAMSHPITGVGLGALGFHFEPFLPGWTFGNPELQEYAADLPGTPWPSVHGLWARLAAETGLIGLALFASAWFFVLRDAWRRAALAARVGRRDSCLLWLALFWSGVGCVVVGFAFDSLRFGGYWLVLSASWAAQSGVPDDHAR